MERIYRGYRDTEVTILSTQVQCPYCNREWLEEDKNDCGELYILNCDEDDGGCGKDFEMYFDAD